MHGKKFHPVCVLCGSHGGLQGLLSGYVDGLCAVQVRFDSWQRQETSTMSRLALGAIQPPVQWVLGVLSLGVKWPGHKLTTQPPYSAKVKNGGTIRPLP
jgi:hypothetical protein